MGQSDSDLEVKVAELAAELAEARRQQIATSEVLRVIASSPTDVRPVLNAVAESAATLCDAYDAIILLRRGDSLILGAHHGPIPFDFTSWPVNRNWVTGRAVVDRVPVHVHDLLADGDEFPEGRAMAIRLGHRTTFAVPLLREQEAVGALVLRRREVRPFSTKQIELLQTFADQALIAIENARLFEEVQARNREVSEALEQQTATADVLKAISRSTFDLDTVLETLIASACRLCDARSAQVWRRDGDVYRLAVSHQFSQDHSRLFRLAEVRPGWGSTVSRALQEMHAVQIVDVLEDPDYEMKDEARVGNIRTILAAPLLRNGEPIGVFAFSRERVEPFTNRQIELVETFADQAVIAIENARLFQEVQQRSAELAESLEQQTVTADVLKIISRSAFDLQAVLDTLVESAKRVCEADMASIMQRDSDLVKFAANAGFPQALVDYAKTHPARVDDEGGVVGRAMTSRRSVHLPDVLKEPNYSYSEYQKRSGYRSILAVPLLREGVPIGVFILTRSKVAPFTSKQIELVETFADQAVIAIENVRLFSELEARNREILSRYFSPNLAQRLAAGVDEIELAGQRREVAALFTDIEGFTSLVETMEPGTLGELLNGYLAGMTSVVFSHEGTVAKVVGDALHVLFGAPGDQPDRAARAVACALDLDQFAQSFRENWRGRGITLGVTRIGVNAGPAIVGNFGGGRFFDYTAYGDTINIAARLETANKQLGTRVCVSDSVATQVPNFKGRPVGDLVLRGRAEPLRAFEPLRSEQYDDPSTEGYLKAFAKLEAGDVGALGAFATEVGKQPGDRLASFHLKRLLNGATGIRINMD